MRVVPVIRTQDAYNCGLYSLWMACESLTRADEKLIKKIKNESKIYTDSMGGVFNYVFMERIVESLGYKIRRVRFHDRNSFVNNLNIHANDAILIAYSLEFLNAGHSFFPVQSAHWSVIESIDGTNTNITIVNPHGYRHVVLVDDMVNANLQLRTTIEPDSGRFDWKGFVVDQRESSLFKEQAKSYKNTSEELTKRGRDKTYLGGFFICISV